MDGKNFNSIFNLKSNNSKLKKDMKRQDNQAPDEAMLTLWIDGELSGDELAQVELWAQDHPELLAERDAVRAMQSNIQANMPASVEPPYADFFNQRILQAIENEKAESAGRVRSTGSQWLGNKLSKWLALPAAAAAMVMCFYMGTQVSHMPDSVAPVAAVSAVSVEPAIYMPDGDVRANIFSSDDNGATVIVLEGLEDIPDDFEIVGEPRHSRSASSRVVTVNTEMVF